jgi:puromycin-sensitive aminopeptidase
VATRAGRQEYDALLAHFRAPSDPIEEQRYLDSLSYVRDLDLVAETCELCLNEIRSQDAPYILRRLLTNRVAGPQVWQFISGHWDTLLERYPANSITEFCAAHPFGGQQRSVDQSLERLAINVRFVLEHRSLLGAILAKA